MREQQPPKPNGNAPAVWDLVLADMIQRNKDGTAKYGTPLQPFNGRKPLVDAYQEALDLVVYLRQEIEERAAGKCCLIPCGELERNLLREEISCLVAERDIDRKGLRTVTAERDAARSELETARQVIASNGQALCKLQAEKDEAWRQIDALTEELATETARSGNIRSIAAKDRDDFNRELSQLKGVRDSHYAFGQRMEREKGELAKQLADARAGLVAVTEERDKLLEMLDGERGTYKRRQAKLEGMLGDAKDEARKDLNTIRFHRDELIEEKSRLRELADKQGEAIATLTRERDEAREELNSSRWDAAVRAGQVWDEKVKGLEDELAAFRKVVRLIAYPPK